MKAHLVFGIGGADEHEREVGREALVEPEVRPPLLQFAALHAACRAKRAHHRNEISEPEVGELVAHRQRDVRLRERRGLRRVHEQRDL